MLNCSNELVPFFGPDNVKFINFKLPKKYLNVRPSGGKVFLIMFMAIIGVIFLSAPLIGALKIVDDNCSNNVLKIILVLLVILLLLLILVVLVLSIMLFWKDLDFFKSFIVYVGIYFAIIFVPSLILSMLKADSTEQRAIFGVLLMFGALFGSVMVGVGYQFGFDDSLWKKILEPVMEVNASYLPVIQYLFNEYIKDCEIKKIDTDLTITPQLLHIDSIRQSCYYEYISPFINYIKKHHANSFDHNIKQVSQILLWHFEQIRFYWS